MFGRTWHHDTLRKYVILFGTIFNDIWITRDSASGESIQTLKVPLSYGPKENITRARYRPLRKSEFDLDDPTEYPCASCGAQRKAPCNGEKPECAFRVFFIGGGKL